MTATPVSSYYPSFKISPLFEIPSYLHLHGTVLRLLQLLVKPLAQDVS